MKDDDVVTTVRGLKDWIWIIVVVATASVANMGAMYQIRWSLSQDMIDLDRRWQDRTLKMTAEIRQDIDAVRGSIPPDWFRQMVQDNKDQLRRMEERLDDIERRGAPNG